MAFSPKNFYAKHPILSTLILIFLSGLVLIWATLIFLDYWTMHGETSIVPDVKNTSYAQATEILRNSDLGIEIADSIYDAKLAPGTVVETMPRAGAVVKRGRQVYATITAFSPKQITITMPLANSVSARQAISYLRGLGLQDIRTVYVPAEYPDLVVSAKSGSTSLSVGSVLPINSTITLEVGVVPVAEPVFDDEDDQPIESEVEDAFGHAAEIATGEF